MPGSMDLFIAIAVATFVVPLILLVLVAAGLTRRSRTGMVGRGLEHAIAFLGGLTLGTFLLMGGDLTLAAPILLVAGGLVLSQLRRLRRGMAGWLLVGLGLPTLAYTTLASATGTPPAPSLVAAGTSAAWPLAAFAAIVVGAVFVWSGDPAPGPPSPAAPVGQPGSRAIGSIALAVREPGFIGPIGIPELALLGAVIATYLVVPFLLPRDASSIVRIGAPAVVAALLGTEAYIRAMPSRSRRAFEAFSWLGEWELARARALGGRVPTTPAAAEQWLASHADTPESRSIRVEVLLLAGRFDAAREAVRAMPRDTAWQRFDQAAAFDLVDWRAGGDGDLVAMERSAAGIQPEDGDERLRAEVSIALARVRRRMADGRSTPGDAADPLLEVRERLGRRADGQVGRALRRRIIPVMLVVLLAIGIAGELMTLPLVAAG